MTAEEAADALAGRGAGIGLANVHARLQSTFGPEYGLEVESAPGEGHGGADARAEVPRGGARGVTLRVLAVDDERPALDDLARVLRAQPAVAEVDDGRVRRGGAARARGREHYDAVFLDVRMPGLDGVELARVLRRFAVAAGADLRLRLRVGGGRGVRAARARLPAQAGVAGAGGGGARARGAASRRTTRRRRSRSTCRAAARGSCAATTCSTCSRTATTCAWSRADGRFLVRGTLGRSSAAGRRTASTACTGASSSTCARDRGAPAAQRHRAADPGRRRRAADRPPRGRGAATAAALMSRLPPPT